MRELNPIGREGDSLLLVTKDGERFSLSVDETLLKTIKEHRVPDSNTNQLSPRQIQDAIRSGVTITELSETSGTSLDLIERFAHPVIEELLHMVELAKSVRIEQPADRFNEVSKRPFGDVIEEKLTQSQAVEIEWSAKRGPSAVWEVSVAFSRDGESGMATWSFDPRKYLLTPETSIAASLSSSSARLESLLGPTSMAKATKVEASAEPSEVVTEDNLLAFRNRRNQTQPIAVQVEPEPIEASPDTAEDLIPEGLIEENPTESTEEPQASEEEAPEPESLKPTEPKKVRAPMPSWDQIVRGTQTDDGEAF